MLVTILECDEHGRQGVIGITGQETGDLLAVITFDDGRVLRGIDKTGALPACAFCDERLWFKFYEFA